MVELSLSNIVYGVAHLIIIAIHVILSVLDVVVAIECLSALFQMTLFVVALDIMAILQLSALSVSPLAAFQSPTPMAGPTTIADLTAVADQNADTKMTTITICAKSSWLLLSKPSHKTRSSND